VSASNQPSTRRVLAAPVLLVDLGAQGLRAALRRDLREERLETGLGGEGLQRAPPDEHDVVAAPTVWGRPAGGWRG